jgi:hypothetical protein
MPSLSSSFTVHQALILRPTRVPDKVGLNKKGARHNDISPSEIRV